MTGAASSEQFYKVLYTKRAANKKRKNKSFADGILQVKAGIDCVLYSEDGKVAGKSRVKGCHDIPEGAELVVGIWEVEVDVSLPEKSFRSGECFMNSPSVANDEPVAPRAKLPATGFRPPLRTANAMIQRAPAPPKWVHNPAAEGAVVLNPDQPGSIPVVIDPYISRKMRTHQCAGTAFLYSCVMGLRSPGFQGAILADEMGLGKTIQVIALVWTLLKQGPQSKPGDPDGFYGQGKPTIKKCIIVTPSTLTNNWAAEFRKWLGDERLKPLVLQTGPEAKAQVNDFKYATACHVLVASYETLRSHAADLAGFCDLLVCDEGHRLKAAGGSKTTDALLALGCARRVLLTGTPLQNNLDELYALTYFVNPDILGSLSSFKSVFAGPIARSQDRNATPAEAALGAERLKELGRRMEAFMLRRVSDEIAKFLPPLASYVVFCRPSQRQVEVYREILQSKQVSSLLSGYGQIDALPAITKLRKLCNHPCLLEGELASDISPTAALAALAPDPETLVALSGKLAALEALMRATLGPTQDRMVVVSGSMKALDLVQAVCSRHAWRTQRIDGSTPPGSRQDVVTNFNRLRIGEVFLLSTRAGGAGLNLIGANRLVLFDSDWNPAADLQAMARVWREGQKKPCVIYRLLCTGTIEEKIYQRQLTKGKLMGVMDVKAGKGGKFSREELKELFRLDTQTTCNTSDLLPGFGDATADVQDRPLASVVSQGLASFVHLAEPLSAAAAAEADAPPHAPPELDSLS